LKTCSDQIDVEQININQRLASLTFGSRKSFCAQKLVKWRHDNHDNQRSITFFTQKHLREILLPTTNYLKIPQIEQLPIIIVAKNNAKPSHFMC